MYKNCGPFLWASSAVLSSWFAGGNPNVRSTRRLFRLLLNPWDTNRVQLTCRERTQQHLFNINNIQTTVVCLCLIEFPRIVFEAPHKNNSKPIKNHQLVCFCHVLPLTHITPFFPFCFPLLRYASRHRSCCRVPLRETRSNGIIT